MPKFGFSTIELLLPVLKKENGNIVLKISLSTVDFGYLSYIT